MTSLGASAVTLFEHALGLIELKAGTRRALSRTLCTTAQTGRVCECEEGAPEDCGFRGWRQRRLAVLR